MSETTDTVVRAKPKKTDFWRVVPSHNLLKASNRVYFRSLSESRAKNWVETHCPRGSEMHLVAPNGETFHYENERRDETGGDVDLWQPFDPEEWNPPTQSEPPGQDEWADAEG